MEGDPKTDIAIIIHSIYDPLRPSLVPILDLRILKQRYPTLEVKQAITCYLHCMHKIYNILQAAPFPSLSKLGHNMK